MVSATRNAVKMCSRRQRNVFSGVFLRWLQHNVRFFLEILQNRKSDTLEWIIILLITGEICVSLYDILHTAKVI